MKRFTETEKWRDSWFRKLTPGVKLAFLYIVDNCDAAGVWEGDTELAEFTIGMTIPWDKVKDALGDRVEIMESGKWWLTRFIRFQYGTLSEDCKPHQNILRLLNAHKIDSKPYLLPFPKGSGKGQGIGKGIGKGKEGGVGEKPMSRDEAADYAVEIGMTEAEFESWFDHFESNGWKVSGKAAMKDWKAAMRNGKRRAGQFKAPLKTSQMLMQ